MCSCCLICSPPASVLEVMVALMQSRQKDYRLDQWQGRGVEVAAASVLGFLSRGFFPVYAAGRCRSSMLAHNILNVFI